MTLPAFIFGLLIATLVGALFHLWRGGSFGRLVLYVGLSWAGFWGGQVFASLSGWSFFSLGPLHLGMSLLGSVVILGGGYWLSLFQVEKLA